METTPGIAVSLLQAGALVGMLVLVQVYAVRHLPAESIPQALRSRVELSNRLRPWLLLAVVLMAAAGVLLHLG
ncbi:hypothetical protein [Nocardioides donggukensis]|uniref:Uncharacterized protein n=1 Tax=Nocardioides donggukensis TaxID=2774019 RepID=A0A927K4G6_9ACTN|nr:hypothetical protein [Nocardioides donggukensis]MBD8870309.1 hypothetical protein [Nocardioides donggukensis]